MTKRPAVVEAASWLLWALVAAGAAVTVLVIAFQDEIGDRWSPMSTGDSKVEPLEFVPVIVVLYGVIGLTTLFLIPLLRHGHNWSRHSLAGISAGILLAAAATARTSPPTVIRFSAIAAAVVSAVALVFLWHLDSRRFCREAEAEAEAEAQAAQATRAAEAADAEAADSSA